MGDDSGFWTLLVLPFVTDSVHFFWSSLQPSMKRRNENQHLQVLRHGRQLEKDGVPTPGQGCVIVPRKSLNISRSCLGVMGKGSGRLTQSEKAKVSIYWSSNVPTLNYCKEPWVVTKRIRFWIIFISRTRWTDNSSRLPWESLGVSSNKLEEVARLTFKIPVKYNLMLLKQERY